MQNQIVSESLELYLYHKDLLYENLILNSINEELNFDKIKQLVLKVKNKERLFNNIIEKFNRAKNFDYKKNLAKILMITFFVAFALKTNKWASAAPTIKEKIAVEIAQKEKINKEVVEEILGPLFNENSLEKQINEKAIDINTAKISDAGKDLIKDHEKLRLTAYAIGDGMITIGWGHAEPKATSKFKLGQKITPEQANILFTKDIQIAENAVKRIFKQWEEDGKDVKITQSMFDAMVSMTFNMGSKGIRTTDFIQKLKNKDYLDAAEIIKNTRVSSKFPGLEKRRTEESDLFLKDLTP